MKSKRKMYRMYIHPERHKDIYEYLEKIDHPMRGEIIRAALRLYILLQGNKLSWDPRQASSNANGVRTQAPEITHDLNEAFPFG